MYTVDYFLQKLGAVPESNWCVGYFVYGSNHCALGHCGETSYGVTQESLALFGLFVDNHMDVVGVNDGQIKEYYQSTPKQRVLAALRDIKKMQDQKDQPKETYPDITKQLAILPEDKRETDVEVKHTTIQL